MKALPRSSFEVIKSEFLFQLLMGLFGTVRISVCERAIERYAAMALMKRSPNMTAN